MPSKLRHVGLVVRDLAKSVHFYQHFFGMIILKEAVEEGPFISRLVGIPNAKVAWVKLEDRQSGVLLELLHYRIPVDVMTPVVLQASNAVSCFHLALTVMEIDLLYQTLLASGVTCKSEPLLSSDGAVKVCYIHDPDGMILEIVEELVPPEEI